MSMRSTKRATVVRDGEQPSTSTAGPSTSSTSSSKRRRTDPDDPLWQLRPVSDLKMSSIYNRSAPEAPAELFRKDLISAMKLPDNEPLTSSEYWVITDPWKQDWERGVQVPVNPDSLPAPKVKIIDNPQPPGQTDFKLPKEKYIHLSRDAHYAPEKHQLSATPASAEAACAYDLDATDACWLKLLNAERARAGAAAVTENQFEKVIEELEVRTWDKIQALVKSEEGLGIEYDENVICDVCRSPDSEDGNEMVFCDSCNICVHQACYGITVIPDGQWLCRPCGDGVRPTCVLCPNQGGAMKCTPSGHKWAHVSCVLWIPEVSIGCAEKMEPITKISSIPASRWSLMCVLCRERKGSCIQCSVKSCKTAYHVTCAFKHGLEMRAIIEDENADDGVKLRSYCQKHSVNSKKEKSGSGSEEEEVKRKRRKDMTSEEKSQARNARLHEIEKEFDKHVSVKDISSHLLDVDQDAINYIYNYWKLKRRSGNNRPLLPPKKDDNELLSHRQEQADLDKMKMFVQLRQDLERVRNLCYMVSRREKLSRSFFRLREQTFHKQMTVLSAGDTIPKEELAAIHSANHGPSIYDTLYSHPDVPDHKIDFEDLLTKIAPPDSNDDKKKDRNGLRRSKSSNPYRKHYVNGSRRSGSMYSGLSSEESDAEIARSSKYRARAIGSTTDDDDAKKKPSTSSPKKKVSPKAKAAKISPRKNDKKKKKAPQSKAVVESSTEDDVATAPSKKSGSKTLRQMEKEMTAGKRGQSGSDSDDLLPIRSTRSTKFPVDIYSDSSEESADDKTDVKKGEKIKYIKEEKYTSEKSPNASDPQQSLPRTKAAMKEFVPSHVEKKEPVSAEEKPAPKKRGRKPSNKEKKPPVKTHESDDEAKNKENKFSKPKDNPTDLIVPQRQAAKKASENMRSTSTGKKEENAIEKSPEEVKIKAKGKGKGKEIKSPSAKLTRQTSKDAEKETIAYVPQRQAAKKAAAHIKNIGSKVPAPETAEASKKKEEKQEKPESDESPSKKKVESKESSSSSSGSSSSSYSSSSSSEYEEPEKVGPKPASKAREIKPATAAKPPSLFSPPSARPTVDLPFLDKVSKPLSSTSASSDSDSHSDGSGSSSPTPKRPRRRRKHVTDVNAPHAGASPRKAPDTKLKTSERESERGVSPPAAERDEPTGTDDAGARAATRVRTRSTAAGGILPELPDAGSGKPSKDDAAHASTPEKTPKESCESSELPPPERKTHETLKDSPKEAKKRSSPKTRRSSTVLDHTPEHSLTHNDLKPKPCKLKRLSVSEEREKPKEKQPSPLLDKPSPKKNVEQRRKSISSRRMSVKEPLQKDTKDQVVPTAEEVIEPIKQRRQSRYETRDTKTPRESVSPGKKLATDKPQAEVPEKKAAIRMNNDYNDSEKWLPKAPSPTHVLTPIERPGGNEKYMTDDKSFDSADVCTEKSSVKMIAKIQANLNENTMIKSPRTPMDARSLAPEEDNTVKNLRKRSTLEAVTQQDASHVQGVEISKSAKIPSTVYHDRPPTSPQQKDNELFAFDMLAVDDGFNHDEIMKPFSSFPEFFFKEDSKEQGRQETLNLVDRLRMQLSAKKAPENCQQEQAAGDKEHAADEQTVDDYREEDYREDDYREEHRIDIHKGEDHIMQDVSNKQDGELSPVREFRQEMETHVVSPLQHHHNTMNHIQHSIAPAEMPRRKSALEEKEYHPMPMTINDKWQSDAALSGPHMEQESRKYEHNAYNEEPKEPHVPPTSEVRPASELGDASSLSKLSDDSQPSAVDNSNSAIDVETVRESEHAHSHALSHSLSHAHAHSHAHSHVHPYENNEPLRSECGRVSSPYAGHEWRESEIPRRRSSASSSDSEASGAREPHAVTVAGGMPEIDSYPPIPAYSCPVEPSMPLNQYATYAPDASPFLTTMGSLFGGGACSQLPLPSPGPLYAPSLAYTPSGLLPPKPPFRRLCAAFTSSSQNIALTTAMIAPPTPKQMDSPSRDDAVDVTPCDKFSIEPSSPSICVDDSTYETSQSRTAKMSNDSNETLSSVSQQECKSPVKLIPPLRLPIKFPGKSPGKSPGISPKRSEASKGSKRSNNRSNRGNRGRGRSKSRGHSVHPYPPVDYLGESIRNKLVGTVYDFEEEIANDGVDLKALRERRKSIDVRDDRRSELLYKDTSQSPRVHSPQRASKKTPISETREYRAVVEDEPETLSEGGSADGRGFVHVPPLLPGPVDMRTYQPEAAPAGEYLRPALAYAAAAASAASAAAAAAAAERHLAHLEEEHAAPPAPAAPHPPAHAHAPHVPQDAYVPLPKVSLSDSRNQLKVKIKGPFLDANYSASSVAPPAPPPAPPLEPPAGAFTAVGSTSLRRMRKKELLRQYWTQDMNMDEPTSGVLMGAVPPPAAPLPQRTVITIPKAVASMTSIPTREDYKIFEPPVVETKKKRKVSSGLSRELRHLKVTMNDETDPSDEAKLSSLAAAAGAHKRRARLSVKPPKAASTPQLAPKLKIKIGADTVPHVSEEPSDFRPPKKRLIHKPSLEDLRRESMKYRKMVMADFEENEKTTKHKSSKSEKRKKKKDKKADKLQVVNSKSESAPKLIIKIKRPKAPGGPAAGAAPGAAPGAPAAAAVESAVNPFEYDPTAPDPLALDTPCYSEALSAMRKVRTAKVTPIRLKLARTQGSSYVMKGGASPAPGAPPPPAPAPLDEHADVR